MKATRSTMVFASGIILLYTLVACSPQPKVYQEQLIGFGTLIDISIWDIDKDSGQQAIAAVADDLAYMHRAWHAWKPGSLGRINQLLPLGEWFSISPGLITLIERAQILSKQSGGRFNPAIGNLIALWGFASDDPPKGPPPEPEAIDAVLASNPSMDDIELNGIRLKGSNPSVKLDFGAFAKGAAVDIAIEHLRDLGIHNAIVNAGGDLRAIGRHGDRAWRVGIRNPRGPGMLASIEVEGDESVFTSGDYERFFEHDGIRYYHIIDPRTGYPARGTISVTVFHGNAAEADAAATALFVAGPEDWYEVAKAMGVTNVLLVDTRGTVHMTPNLRTRIHFEIDPAPKVIVSEPL